MKELCHCIGVKCRKASWIAEINRDGSLAHLAPQAISALNEYQCKVERNNEVIYFGKLAEAA